MLANTKRIVIKLGTGLLTSGVGKLDITRIKKLSEKFTLFKKQGMEVIIVSSGAIGLGMGRLNLKKRPTDLATLQACAAIGQTILVDTWQNAFDPCKITVAQLLLTQDDIRGRNRHVNIKNTIEKLLSLDIVPIINENDSISTEEITFGDNDILSALVSSLTRAQMLLILSTIPGLIDRKGSGKIVPVVKELTPEIEHMAQGTKSITAVGGMRSKIQAAKIAIRSGCGVFICNGNKPEILEQLLSTKAQGTFFIPHTISTSSE
jgi:glutamate 5-kinase